MPTVRRFSGMFTRVCHGPVWQFTPGTDLGSGFLREYWVRFTRDNQGAVYIGSDGPGGAHAWLDGGETGGGVVRITGNVWDGERLWSFGSATRFAVGEWVHVRIAWTAATGLIRVWINGVGAGEAYFPGPRVAGSGGAGVLFIGGSDHQNAAFDLAAVRAFDRAFPGPAMSRYGFVPKRAFGGFVVDGGTLIPVDFLPDYGAPGAVIPDHAPLGVVSWDGGPPVRHPGVIGGSWAAGYDAHLDDVPGYPPVEFPSSVDDPTCPYGQRYEDVPEPAELDRVPATPPTGAVLFDSFGRRNQTGAYQAHPTLGDLEVGGSWKVSIPDSWGIVDGHAVYLDGSPGIAWDDLGSADQDVRVDCLRAPWSRGATGVSFRVDTDNPSNYWRAYVDAKIEPSGVLKTALCVGFKLNGVMTEIAGPYGLPIGDDWTTLRVQPVGDVIRVYLDDTLAFEATGQTALRCATGCGLSNVPAYGEPSSFARYGNFRGVRA